MRVYLVPRNRYSAAQEVQGHVFDPLFYKNGDDIGMVYSLRSKWQRAMYNLFLPNPTGRYAETVPKVSFAFLSFFFFLRQYKPKQVMAGDAPATYLNGK